MSSTRRFLIAFFSLVIIWAVEARDVTGDPYANPCPFICMPHEEFDECLPYEDMVDLCDNLCGPSEGWDPVCLTTSIYCETGDDTIQCDGIH